MDWCAWLLATTGEQQPPASGIDAFTTGSGASWGRSAVKDPASAEGAELSWEAFWAPGLPFMHSGAAHVRLELCAPEGR